jgi:hypothetical protein
MEPYRTRLADHTEIKMTQQPYLRLSNDRGSLLLRSLAQTEDAETFDGKLGASGVFQDCARIT